MDAAEIESPKKRKIVETAYHLFKTRGFYATGVDLIMQTASVSKRTLYKYFPTKNELIVSVLNYYRAAYADYFNQILAQQDKSSRQKILNIFEDAEQWFEDINFHGCLAVNAMGEFSGKDRAIEDSCIRFKQWEIDMLTMLTRDITSRQSEELAYKLFVLLEGMSAIAQVAKGKCPVNMTAMADEMIKKYL
ncbi:transcriptional regulator, TetR family [Nitrosomonas marina]|uniref:Transcriptional regulator, TetR family n=2 Tax=Nitrosomonas marina TaxID=917 RepID=A0A1H9YKA0_9PROT|nr:transcriptional regulator, TetR family [Nitrosomonas marina]